MQQPDRYLIRDAKPEEQRELTRLCVHATLHTGYDDAFVDRVMRGLTVMLPLITAGAVQVAEQPSCAAVGVVTVYTWIRHFGDAESGSAFLERRWLAQGP
jgi:hypothetical protein